MRPSTTPSTSALSNSRISMAAHCTGSRRSTASTVAATSRRYDATDRHGTVVMPSKFVRALGKRLDARPDRLDLRDREFAPLVVSLPPRFPDDATVRTLLPAYVRAGLILSQGNEGACTGFGLACVVNYLFWRKRARVGRDAKQGEGRTRQHAHALSPRALLRRMARRGLRRLELSRRAQRLEQTRRLRRIAVAVSRPPRQRAIHQAESGLGHRCAATPARRVLPHQRRRRSSTCRPRSISRAPSMSRQTSTMAGTSRRRRVRSRVTTRCR